MHSERYATGLNILRQVDGKGGEVVLEACGISRPTLPATSLNFRLETSTPVPDSI